MIDFKEILRKRYLDTANVNLYLFENRKTEDAPFLVHELNISSDVVVQIRSIAGEYLASILDQAESQDGIPEYNADGSQDLFKVASSEVPLFAELYPFVSGAKTRGVYDRKKVREDRLKAWLFRFEARIDGKIEQILFFQQFQPGRMLGSKGITIFEKGRQFRLLENNALHFNRVMDLVYYQGDFIVTKASAFESIFSYVEYYTARAKELVTKIKGRGHRDYAVRFVDLDAVTARIEMSSRLARKLSSAHVNKYFRKIHFDRLAALNKRHQLNLNLDAKSREWVIDNQLDLQVMAQILNDDYEFSQLTDNEYIAIGKSRLS